VEEDGEEKDEGQGEAGNGGKKGGDKPPREGGGKSKK
jgi:hypothetical protein